MLLLAPLTAQNPAFANYYEAADIAQPRATVLAVNSTQLHRQNLKASAAGEPINFSVSPGKTMADTHFLVVNAGFVGIFNRFKETLRYGAELRWREMGALNIRPSAGVVNAENDASYYFLGLRRDFRLSQHFLATASFDAGYFEERNELKLGLQMEFRTGAELSYRFANDYRVGLAMYHLSNGGFGDRNPGTESIVLSLIVSVH